MARPQKPVEDPMVAKAFDASKHDDLARAIEQLSPEQAQFFITKLEAAYRKRKLQLTGYLIALTVWLVSMVGAFIYAAISEKFVGWAFVIPFGLVGLILYGFGKWSTRIGSAATLSEITPDRSVAHTSQPPH